MNKLKNLLILFLIAAMLLTAAACTGTAQTDGASQTEAETPSDDTAEVPTDETAEAPADGESEAAADPSSKVATADQMTTVEDVVEDDMVPIYGSSIQDGVYDVTVDCSSSMFPIARCELTVADGEMTAVLYMNSTSYLWVYAGTALEAASTVEEDYIPYVETEDGIYTFALPVEALDAGVPCAAYSKNKELWYDRTLVFRADSLPASAFDSSLFTTAADLGLADGSYTVAVQLEGGSGKASVESPAVLRVEDGAAYATLIWSSSNYDYMRVEEEQYLPINTEGNSTFEIPVTTFDRKITVYADTTAMSVPHEIEYTLYFDSASITNAE